MNVFIKLVLALMVGSILFVAGGSKKERLTAEEREHQLLDMSIPPKLSARMRSDSWTIEHWIMADKFDPDCKVANEYMDDNVVSKTRTRNGSSYTRTIFEYLSSCKNASKRARTLVEPRAKKWCNYRSSDERLDILCTEWETNGELYLNKIDESYKVTIKRFQEITNGYYDDRLTGI